MIKTVFFDLGNTLLYTDHRIGILEAVQALTSSIAAQGYAIDAAELAQIHYEKLTEYYKSREADLVEIEARDFLRQTLTEAGLTQISEEHITSAIQSFYAQTEKNWHLTEYAIPALRELKAMGKKLGVITNASSAYDIRQLLHMNGLDDWFDSVTISAVCGYRKPHSNIFIEALRSADSLAQESIMVGDTFIADIYGSSQVGMHNIWFNRYTEDWSTLALFSDLHADAETQDLREIPTIIDNLF